MQRNPNLPKPEDLITGRVYRLDCRNLSYGAWNGKDGFIGIRTKFNDRFLDTEFHWDCDPYHGTVSNAEDTGINVVGSIEQSLGTEDSITKRRVMFDKPVKDGGKGWYFVDTGESSFDIRPVSVLNTGLFKSLDNIKNIIDLDRNSFIEDEED